MNNSKPEFKAPQIKQRTTLFKYETKYVPTVGTGPEVADRIQNKIELAADAGFRLAHSLQMPSEAILIFEKTVSETGFK